MSYINTFLISFCAAAVFIGALYMLCPDGAMQKPIKYLVSLLFLLSVISVAGITVKNAELNLDFTLPQTDSTDLEIKNAEYVYAFALRNADIGFREIEIFTTKADDGGIIINKVIVHSDCERQKIVDALSEATKNIEVEVVND